jgi:hypothetical protein
MQMQEQQLCGVRGAFARRASGRDCGPGWVFAGDSEKIWVYGQSRLASPGRAGMVVYGASASADAGSNEWAVGPRANPGIRRSSFTFTEENLMTITTNSLTRLVAAAAVALVAVPASVLAAPVIDAVAEDDDDDDDDDDDCDDKDDDCDAEGHVKGGCSSTIAPDLGQGIGGLLCTLGLLGWQLRRRRAA